MIEREKVIKGLEELSSFLFREYGKAQAEEANLCYDRFLAVDNALALLKEPKENKWIDHLYRFNDTRIECKSCYRTAAKSYPFCPWCGLTMNGVEIEADFVKE